MKKYKLHKWFALVLIVCLMAGCSKKNYPSNNAADTETPYDNSKKTNDNDYTPPPVISISDDIAKSNKDGELYYDNEYGFRYWRYCDGKYYLDSKYEKGEAPKRKYAKKNTKKHNKKQQKQNETDEDAVE